MAVSTGQFTLEKGLATPRASVIIVNYNGRKYLEQCLSSLLQEDYPDYEALVVDNASSDGSADYVETTFPTVKVIRSGENVGYGHGCNLGLEYALGEYIAFLNADTKGGPGWLQALVSALECHPDAGLVTPKILLTSQPERINTCGNQVHFTGLAFCRGAGRPAGEYDLTEEVPAVSGAAFMTRRSVLEEMGGLDGQFFMYLEDTDLSWRARLSGYRCLCVPDAVVYHDYGLRLTPQKYYYLERNRYLILLKNLRWRTMLLFTPALILSEVVTWGYALLRGPRYLAQKLRGYLWLLRQGRSILQARRAVQRLRRAPDREVLRAHTHRLAFDQAMGGPLAFLAGRIFNPLYFLLHQVGMALLRW